MVVGSSPTVSTMAYIEFHNLFTPQEIFTFDQGIQRINNFYFHDYKDNWEEEFDKYNKSFNLRENKMFKTGQRVRPTSKAAISNGMRVDGILEAEVVTPFEAKTTASGRCTGNFVGTIRVLRAKTSQTRNFIGQQIIVSSKNFERVGAETVTVKATKPFEKRQVSFSHSGHTSISSSAPSWIQPKSKPNQLRLILALS
jgi:hypothetical protein